MKNKAKNIKMVIEHFASKNSVLPPDLCQLCLEFSGLLRIGRKSLVFLTWNIPHYKGRIMRRISLEKDLPGNKDVI